MRVQTAKAMLWVWGLACLMSGSARAQPVKSPPLLPPPAARYGHSAVWTGTEMIVWGGDNNKGRINTGARYAPAANGWTAATAVAGAPSARMAHTAVWTGTEMIVWGGYAGTELDTGGRYDPATNRWTATATAGAPAPRRNHTAVWTGTEMIIWGGESGAYPHIDYHDTGARYDPVKNSWSATAREGAPLARSVHAAVWTGTEMFVWGGYEVNNVSKIRVLGTGGRYNPAANSWAATAAAGAPAARGGPDAVWTGREVIVWGGDEGGNYLNTGGRYDPAGNSWTAMAAANAPTARGVRSAVWTGKEMLFWGGQDARSWLGSGGRYDPASGLWTLPSLLHAPSARNAHSAVWTGTELIVWGGAYRGGILNTGGRYDPAADAWTATAGKPAAGSKRGRHR